VAAAAAAAKRKGGNMDLLNGILNGGLGEDYTHSGGSYSSANGGTQTSYWDNSAELEAQRQRQAEIAAHNAEIAAHNAEVTMQNNDPYRQHILTDATTGAKYLLLSDGTTTWKIGGNAGATTRDLNPFGTRSVAEVLHNWLSQNYRHGWIVGRSAQTSTDTEKTSAYATALANGNVISLSQVLQSVNPLTHVFYVPDGYFYAGDVSEVPSVSEGDATDAGNRANYGKNPFVTTTAPTPTASEDDNTMLFLLLPILSLAVSKMLKKNNKRKKR
jgi:hypothetical protein